MLVYIIVNAARGVMCGSAVYVMDYGKKWKLLCVGGSKVQL